MLDENSELSELMNPQKVREFKKEIKLLEKQKVKYERLLAKESGKDKAEMPSEDEEVVENGIGDETGYDSMYEEDDIDEGGNLDSNSEPKSFLKKEPDHKW